MTNIAKELERVLGIAPPENTAELTYNDWLSYFRNVPTTRLLKGKDWLQENLPIEAYAAAARWIEIIGNPHRIDKLLQSKLDSEQEEDLMELAIGDDQEAFYIALVKKTARELNESATSQEVARLSMNLKIFQSELAAIRSKKAKKGSLIEKIMSVSAGALEPSKNAKEAPIPAIKKKGTTCASTSRKKSSSSTKTKKSTTRSSRKSSKKPETSTATKSTGVTSARKPKSKAKSPATSKTPQEKS